VTISPENGSASVIFAIREPENGYASAIRGEHGQDQDWIYCRILAISFDQDWIWKFFFEKHWIRTGSGYLFDFYDKIFMRVIQDVTNDGAVVFFAMIFMFTKNQNDFVSMRCTHHNR